MTLRRIAAATAAHQTFIGVVCAAVTVAAWSLWLVSIRHAATTHLPAEWLGVLRFAPPAILLLPFWWRVGLVPRGVDWRLVVVMVVGAGAPFFMTVAVGMHFAIAAEGGVLIGGSMPLFVGLLFAVLFRERFRTSRVVGFVLIVGAMAAIGGGAVLSGAGASRFLVTAGAFLWAAYTLAFRASQLDAVVAAGVIAAWSTILMLPLALMTGIEPLVAAGPLIVGTQLIMQGVVAGILALICYGVAVSALGPSVAALTAALPPAVAAVIAVPLLCESPTPLSIVGIFLAVAGVALASGAVTFGRD